MDTTDPQPKNEQRSTGIGPGERLQAERIQQGLSLEDVAGRMHLSTSILEAIEVNDFETITAPIFVKGYLRAYARIVSLDEDDMIDQYIDFYSEEDPPITSTSNTSSELSAADPRFKWTTYLVVLIFGVLLATWWWNQQQVDEEPISLDSQSSTVEEPAEVATNAVSSEIEAVSEESIEPGEASEASTAELVSAAETESAATPAVSDPSAVEEEVVKVTVTPVVPEPSVTEAEVVQVEVTESDMAQQEITENEVVEAANGSLETAQGTRNAPSRIAPAGSDKLIIVVHADTWADVKDATSYQLVYDLLRADKSVELMGQAPFIVFLGNGHGVEIMFNGSEIEVAPRIRDDNTARLKIGG